MRRGDVGAVVRRPHLRGAPTPHPRGTVRNPKENWHGLALKKPAGPDRARPARKPIKPTGFLEVLDEPEPGKWAWRGYKETDRPDSDPNPVFLSDSLL